MADFAVVLHAFYACCEVAYIAYMFEKVSNEHFMTVSSLTRAAPLAGRFINALLSIVLIRNISYSTHTYFATAVQITALMVAVILLNFDSSNSTNANQFSLQSTSRDMVMQLKSATSNERVLLWSIWYIFAMGVFHEFIVKHETSIHIFHLRNDEVSETLK